MDADLQRLIRRSFQHTPEKHVEHTADVPCGCAIPRKHDAFICSCGAAYTNEAFSFPVWRCYDCGASWYTSEAVREAVRASRISPRSTTKEKS